MINWVFMFMKEIKNHCFEYTQKIKKKITKKIKKTWKNKQQTEKQV